MAQAAEDPPQLGALEYVVLSKVLSHGLPPETKKVVISAQTTGDADSLVNADSKLEELAKRLDTTPNLLAAWSILNQQRSTLTRQLTLAVPYEILDEAQRAVLFAGEEPALGWTRFHAKYPEVSGLLRVSRVAIDPAEQNALVYIEFACGPECGTGRLVRVSKATGGWEVLSGELLWVAGS